MKSLTKKKLLVIGGSSEIIRSTIHCFHRDGYEIHISCSNQDSLHRTIEGFKAEIPQIKGYKLDLMQNSVSVTFAVVLEISQKYLVYQGYGSLKIQF